MKPIRIEIGKSTGVSGIKALERRTPFCQCALGRALHDRIRVAARQFRGGPDHVANPRNRGYVDCGWPMRSVDIPSQRLRCDPRKQPLHECHSAQSLVFSQVQVTDPVPYGIPEMILLLSARTAL